MAYTSADIKAALASSVRRWSFRYDRVQPDGTTDAVPLLMSKVTLTHNNLADKVRRTLSGGLHPDATFDFSSDRVRPVARLLMADGGWQEWALGTFLLSGSTTTKGVPRGTRPVQGYDLSQIVAEDAFTSRYVVAAGTNYVAAVNTILTGAGFPTSSVESTTKTLPAAMEWEIGTSKQTAINALLSAIDYTPLTMTPYGVPTAGPYVAPEASFVAWEYRLDSASVVKPGLTSTLDLFGVPNVFVGVVSQPERPPLVSTYTNSDPSSVLSTVSRGRSIVSIVDAGDVVDQATLDAKVARVGQAASSQYETVSFAGGLMPFHDNDTVCLIDYGEGGALYREHQWSAALEAGGEMQHEFRRMVQV